MSRGQMGLRQLHRILHAQPLGVFTGKAAVMGRQPCPHQPASPPWTHYSLHTQGMGGKVGHIPFLYVSSMEQVVVGGLRLAQGAWGGVKLGVWAERVKCQELMGETGQKTLDRDPQ